MKRFLIITISISALSLFAISDASAAKADGKKAKLIAKYDKNGNGIIDGEEKEALRKDFAANPNGELKAFDKDADGKLSDEEIAAIKPGSGKGKSAGQKAKKKEKPESDTAKDDTKPAAKE
jgi:hypothetical protein